MNAADLASVMTFFGCAVAAGLVARSENAGWFTVLFVIAGLAIGHGFAVAVGKLAYRLLAVCNRQTKNAYGWAWLIAYTFVPMLAAFGAMAITGLLTFILVRQVR